MLNPDSSCGRANCTPLDTGGHLGGLFFSSQGFELGTLAGPASPHCGIPWGWPRRPPGRSGSRRPLLCSSSALQEQGQLLSVSELGGRGGEMAGERVLGEGLGEGCD